MVANLTRRDTNNGYHTMTVGELTVQSKQMKSSSVIQDLSQVDHSKRLFQPGGDGDYSSKLDTVPSAVSKPSSNSGRLQLVS